MFGFGSNDESRPSIVLERCKQVLSILLRMVHNRFELATTEIQEEYELLWPLLVQTLISFVLIGFGLLFLSLLIIVYFWDTYRLQAIGVVSAFYLIVGFCVAGYVHQKWSQRRRLFASTIEELEKDIRSLEGD